jgi:hypothetical protein
MDSTMAKNRSNASRFPSRYGGGWVSQAQYVTECLCVLIAKHERQELFDQFWNKEPWKAIFRRQVPLAIALLKKHHVEVVLATLRDRRCWKIRSFGAKWLLKPLLAQKQREYDAQQIQAQQTTELVDTSTVQKPRRIKTGKKSLFAQLNETENGNKEKEGCS